ncbi:MAG: TraR/DksA family transcriptional regulator [Bradymonadia bacterium]
MADNPHRRHVYFYELPLEEQANEAERIRHVLYQERQKLLARAQRTLSETMTVDESELVDEIDSAVADNQQHLEMRMRGRERALINKIRDALERLEAGEYFECGDCGDDIPLNRLRARPVTTLCIRCKETQELKERRYA